MGLTGARRLVLIAAALTALLMISLSVASTFYIDLLWYREVGFTSVLWTVLGTRVLVGAVAGALLFVALYVNLIIVRRSSAPTAFTPQQQELERIRQSAEPYLRWALPLGSGALALFVGIGASSQWSTYLLWRNGAGLSFGAPEPLFDRDPSFYVFALPWWNYVQGWLFGALLGVAVLTTAAHLIWGGIQPWAPRTADKVSGLARAHLSVLAGLILVLQAWGYYLDRFDLLTSDRGVVDGASYADVRAQLPALNVLVLAAIITALLLALNARFRLGRPAGIAVALLVLISVLLGRAYPSFVQQFSVRPQEQERESPYIEHNIEATRRAFGLDQVRVVQRPVDPSVSATDLADNELTVSNIRLWRPSVIRENYQSLQRIRQYYEFADVDVDRYTVDGERRVLMISGREVSQNGIPAGGQSWQNAHLVFTHGFGAVAAPVNTASTDGQPLLTLRDIPPIGEPTIDQPRIYYGEVNDVPFVVTNTGARELDYEGASESLEAIYSGSGGIPMGNLVTRSLFAWRYADVNLLISGLIQPDSRIMIRRQLEERVPMAAPFLSFDDDPYLAIVDGRLLWIHDAYTSSAHYPYSQAIELGTVTGNSLGGQVNYVRNSVKVTVDAYTGELTYYLVDENDPIAAAWAETLPQLFTPMSEASEDLLEHFRYPENLFQIQAAMFTSYHVTDPEVFFQRQDVWAIPSDPTASTNVASGALPPMQPYYVLMRLPDAEEENFKLILPFTPEGRQNLTAWMAANSDPDAYGQLTAYTFPSGRNIDGPTQVFAKINQDPTFSTFRTLLGQEGSAIVFGDLLVIPINDSLLYIAPVYVRSNQENAIPELKQVIVVNGDRVGVGTSLSEALEASLQGQPAPEADEDAPVDTDADADADTDADTDADADADTDPDPDSDVGVGTPNEQVVALLDQALARFAAADEALRTGDLATYQEELAAAEALIERARSGG